MKKSWKLTAKILSGQKKIESRWYKTKHAPWDRIKAGETVYFKDSGEPVTIKAKVEKVVQIADLTPAKVQEILYSRGDEDGLERSEIPKYAEYFKDKKYCMLVHLKNARAIEPFHIDKTGFGLMAAWLTLHSVDAIRKSK